MLQGRPAEKKLKIQLWLLECGPYVSITIRVPVEKHQYIQLDEKRGKVQSITIGWFRSSGFPQVLPAASHPKKATSCCLCHMVVFFISVYHPAALRPIWEDTFKADVLRLCLDVQMGLDLEETLGLLWCVLCPHDFADLIGQTWEIVRYSVPKAESLEFITIVYNESWESG